MGRVTPSGEGDTWTGGRHLGEDDTWWGGHHLGDTWDILLFRIKILYMHKGIVKVCVINKINIMQFCFVRNPSYLQHILSFTKGTNCRRLLQYK